MRVVPESIKLALEDASLPIQKRILLYRRIWNAEDSKYVLETEPIDVTDLLVEVGSIKMALDTDEVDKWDASNVTLTFNNDLNCFKEGLKGGLFEQAVLWGSKFVYNIENSGSQAPQESITVFTGYVYASPVFRENGNQIELTITSSLDALEYVSAEDFCLSAADELATEVKAENDDEQSKEFTTAQNGVGYVDNVKYGTDLQSAQTLSAGTDYDVDNTNMYGSPAKVSLKFTPTAGYKMWVSYRYWHKDMKIEDIVNALLDLAENIDKREIEPAQFAVDAIEYEDNLEEKNYNILFSFDDDGILRPSPSHDTRVTTGTIKEKRFLRLPSKGYIHVFDDYVPTYAGYRGEPYPYPFSPGSVGDNGYLFFQTENGDGIKVTISCPDSSYDFCSLVLVENGEEKVLYSERNRQIIGFEFTNNGINVYSADCSYHGYVTGNIQKTELKNVTVPEVFSSLEYYLFNTRNTAIYTYKLAWREENISPLEWNNKTAKQFYDAVFSTGEYLKERQIRFSFELPSEAVSWRKLEFQRTSVNNGKGIWTYCYSEDNNIWSEAVEADNDTLLPGNHRYLRLYYKSPSNYTQYELFENLRISSFVSSTGIPLVNLTDLTVGDAIAQLAKMVSYEIGFNQDGVFFFRSRQGKYTDVEMEASKLIDVDKHSADIDNLANRVTVEFGNFKTVVDDFTEGKTRPNTIDTYGVHSKEISAGNFIPADNVDISAAVAKANYDALSTPGYTLQIDCRPELSLELGDKITVSSENTQIADKNWSDYSKFLKLPIWKRVFKITGIELSFAKRLMSLTLKDVSSDNDVPNMEYNVYQTQFPTPLDYKE